MPNKKHPTDEMPFLQHIAELRKHLIRSIIAIVVGAVVVVVFWKYIESLIMAPLSSKFVTFQWFNQMSEALGLGTAYDRNFEIQDKLTNLEFGGQFSAFIGVILVCGLIVALPYIIYELFQFLKPGLTSKERKYSNAIMFFTVFFFLLGVAFSYFMVLPLSVQFMYYFNPFGIANEWKLLSYISVFVQTILAMGLVFQMPVIVYFLTKMGIITPTFLKVYRKHAFVVILTLAAIVTPADIMSMFIAAVPLWLLYEFSILISIKVYKELT